MVACVLLAATWMASAADPEPSGTFASPGYPNRQGQTGIGPSNGQPTSTPSVTNGNVNGRTSANGNSTVNQRNPNEPNYSDPNARYDEFGRRIEAAPPQPSEFQKFVETATGRMLPIFGTNFFNDSADTFRSLENVPVSADYTVGPGDEVITRAWGSIDVDYRATVDRNGMLSLPKVGSFNVAGVKASDLERNLRAQIGRLFTGFELSVSLGQLRGLRVFVVGPAMRPGVITLASQSTLLSAVVAAGGPSPTGSMRKILLRRDGRIISELDVYEFLAQGDKSKDMQLAAGDVVVFQPAGPRVAVTGSIDTPAIFELKSAQEKLGDVLRYAGGTPVLTNPNQAQLERIDATQPKAARFVETFRLDAAGQQKPLRDGDVLTLLPISPQFANAVTLRGHVAQPLRYPFTPGMRIRDLIPDRDALISPSFYRRKNLLVQIIDQDDDNGRSMRLTDRDRNDSVNRRDSGNNGGNNSGNNRSNNGGNDNGDVNGTSSLAASSLSRNNGGSSNNSRSTSERDADRIAVERSRKAPVALFDELNWDYAVVERLNPVDLTTQVIPFNLGKAVLQGDDANNIALAPGDVVTIYSQKDIRVPVAKQTRLVSLEGEVNAPGVYQLQPDETLRSLLARAGGFTPQAYAYGLELSREDTRTRQRENLASAIQRLEALAAVQTAREAANRRDDASAATNAAVSNAATQAQIQRLSRLQPNGRIALELTPDTRTLDALPDVALEAADRITVPARPGFVTVSGAVVNSNAFLWKPGRSAGDYLKLAGADEAADTSNMFILRADGTVSSANERRGFFGRGGLDSQVMQPGDALIVPSQLDFETWGRALVRNLKDIAQIVSGFGLGIAAIHTLSN